MAMKSGTPAEPLILRPEQAAAALSIGRTRLYGLLRSGALRSVTINSSRRIRVADLEAYVASLGTDRPEAA